MDVGCNCFGVATAAKVPVKRYNLLVPAIFPVTEPKPDKPLSVGIEKNIGRLSDYLERNEHRIPKVCCCCCSTASWLSLAQPSSYRSLMYVSMLYARYLVVLHGRFTQI